MYVKIIDNNAVSAVAVTPNDSTNLTTGATKGIYVGVSGDLKVTMYDDTVITFVGISNGVFQPITVKRIWATGTTATSIVAVY